MDVTKFLNQIKKSEEYKKNEKVRSFVNTREDVFLALEKLHRHDDLLNALKEFKVRLKAILEIDSSPAGSPDAAVDNKKILTSEVAEELLWNLKDRFEGNKLMEKLKTSCKGIDWQSVEARLRAKPEKLWSINEMERTGGKPRLVGYDKKNGKYIFMDFSRESPSGRTNLCYDRQGQEEAENQGRKPAGNAVDMAASMGVEMLNQSQYRDLQKLRHFDLVTHNWIRTPVDLAADGGAFVGHRINLLENGDAVVRSLSSTNSENTGFRAVLLV